MPLIEAQAQKDIIEPTTTAFYIRKARSYILPKPGRIHLKDLTRAHFTGLYEHLLDTDRKNPLSSAMRRHDEGLYDFVVQRRQAGLSFQTIRDQAIEAFPAEADRLTRDVVSRIWYPPSRARGSHQAEGVSAPDALHGGEQAPAHPPDPDGAPTPEVVLLAGREDPTSPGHSPWPCDPRTCRPCALRQATTSGPEAPPLLRGPTRIAGVTVGATVESTPWVIVRNAG